MLERKDEYWTVGTHIVFRNLGHMNPRKGYQRKTNIYHVLPKDDMHGRLGRVIWFARWRKYVFEPEPETVYEETCLREIAEFVEQETAAHRKAKKGSNDEGI